MGLRAELAALGLRFERSVAGECLISALIVAVVSIGVVWNLPNSYLKSRFTNALQPIAESSGLQQKWSMYAPDPISVVETLQVRVDMAGDGRRTWTFDRDHSPIASLSWYHWQKLKEQLIRNEDALPDFVRWVVGELTRPGDRPVRAEVVLRLERLRTPGDDRPGDVTVKRLYSTAVFTSP